LWTYFNPLNIMKKLLSIGFVFVLAISLTACGSGASNGDNPAKKSSGIAKSSGKMTRDEGQEKLMALSEKLMNGEITPEESKKLQKEIQSNMETTDEMMKRTNNYLSDFDKLPAWATAVGMIEVKGLKLDQSRSDISKGDNKQHVPRSFMAYYKGTAEEVMAEGNRLVKELKLEKNFGDMENGIVASKEFGDISLSLGVRTDVDEPFLSYSASEEFKGDK